MKIMNFHIFLILNLFAISSINQAAVAQNIQNYGKFEGKLHLEAMQGSHKMRLLQDYTYIDPSGKRWIAPAGYETDGASIPKAAWTFVGNPWGAHYRDAAVIHDVACDEAVEKWRVVHLAFYNAMLAAGVSPSKAKLMYAAVYHFGPRWSLTAHGPTRSPAPRLSDEKAKILLASVKKIEAAKGTEREQLDDIESISF